MGNHSPTQSLLRLLEIMQRLRDPDIGCPWDRVQTFETIAPYTVEEAYEVADAIGRNDMQDLCDELGDLLLQVVYHAQMAAEKNQFDFTGVADSICEKMLRRHPHVFQVSDEHRNRDLAQEWERIKTEERALKESSEEDHSALAHIARGMAPLLRATKLQKKAARVNFDWPDAVPVLEKIREELDELTEALRAEDGASNVEEEVGDLLFSVVNISRHLNVDAELALQKANIKFESRFRLMESLASEQNKRLMELSETELERLWEQAKKMQTEKT